MERDYQPLLLTSCAALTQLPKLSYPQFLHLEYGYLLCHDMRIKSSNTWHSPYVVPSVRSAATTRVQEATHLKAPSPLPVPKSLSTHSSLQAIRYSGRIWVSARSPREPRWPSLPAAATRRRVPTGPSSPLPQRVSRPGARAGWGRRVAFPTGAQRRGVPGSAPKTPPRPALPVPPPPELPANMPGGDPEEAADQLLPSSMNEPVRGRAPPESPAMHSRSPKSLRADPAPGVPAQWSRRARNTGHPGCTLQSAQRSWPSPAKRRWAGLRLAGRPRRTPGVLALVAPHVPGPASEVGEPGRGRGEARREGPSGPAGVPYPGHGEGPGRGHEGAGSQVTPGFEPKSLRTGAGVPAGCAGGAGRGASTLTSRSEGPAQLAALADTDERAAARSAVPSPTAGRPGAVQTGRAPVGHRAAPPPPRRALPLRGGVGRGGEQPPTASQAGAQAGQVLSKQVLGSGSGWVLREPSAQPWAARGSAPRLRLQASPPLLFYTPPCYF